MIGETRRGVMMRKGVLQLVAGTTAMITVAPGVACAEVMDKESALAGIWTWTLVLGLLGLLALSALPRGVAVLGGASTTVVGALFFATVLGELADPFVGPAIVTEAGQGYAVYVWTAAAAFVALHALGWAAWARRVSHIRDGVRR